MKAELEQALEVMEQAFRRLEAQVPRPTRSWQGSRFVYRYEEKSIEQAIIQKLARAISSLAAAQTLLSKGYVQEQAALHRAVDEFGEDVFFLVAAITNDAVTELHTRYLNAFYSEEYGDPEDIVRTHKPRDIIPRKKIRAYIYRALGDGIEPSSASKSGDVLHKVYSGFTHGASPAIMEMCGGEPPKFFLFGMAGTPRYDEHLADSWNYCYRTLTAVTAAAKAFGDAELVDTLYQYISQFEHDTGRSGGINSEVAT